MASPSDAISELLLSRPATLGAGRLICIDGPSGSGKSSLAETLDAPVVHVDELIDGWTGLRTVDGPLTSLLRPLAAGEPGTYRRYDWVAGAYAETVTVDPSPLLVLEGVGAGSLAVADLVTVLVWTDAPVEVRKARGIERDGDTFAPYWDNWAAEEAAHFVQNRTRERADLVVES